MVNKLNPKKEKKNRNTKQAGLKESTQYNSNFNPTLCVIILKVSELNAAI